MNSPHIADAYAHTRVRSYAQDRLKLPKVFWAGLKSIGLNPVTILRQSNLPTTVYGGETYINTADNFAIWRTIGELAKDPTMGWKFMSQVETDQYHPTLLAALHARNYRESIEKLARYKRLCSAEEFRTTIDGDEVSVEVCWPFAVEKLPPALLIDAVFALVLELGRRGTKQRIIPKRVELRRPATAGDELENYYGCRVKYCARQNVLVLNRADWEVPFTTHNDELLQMLDPQFEDALKEGGTKQNVLEQVKWVLKRLLSGGRPDLSMVAKELGIGERTLQRRITDEGTTFRQLLNETRHDLARQYLSESSVEITEAAFLVGYEDTTSFYRAFRAWEGTTPAEWRATHQNRKTAK